jgi:hypothetical protein
MIKFQGYAPDLDHTTPGILTDCTALIPTLKGMAGAPSAVDLGLDALAAACQGAVVLVKLDDSIRLIAGTGEKLYELSGTSWTDVTRASGGDYSLATDTRWTFTQFGNISIAATKSDTLQFSASGAFADIAGAPKATIVETVGQFVFAFDTNEATYSDSPNRWWCCAKGDYSDWTPSIATECATGILTSAPGPVKAAKRFGDFVIAYKERSMFLGVYVGAPAIWDFREIPGTVGALGQYAVVNVGSTENPMHIFMGPNDFYQFDGSRPVPIGNPLRETIYGEMNRSFAYLSIAVHDPIRSLVRFYYPSATSALDKCVVYNYKTGRWGRDDRAIEMALQYQSAGITYNDLGSYYSTYQDLPSIAYDSSFWTAQNQIPAVFTTAHSLRSLNGQATASSLTTGDFGDDERFTMLDRISPRWITKPASATLTNYYRANSGDVLTTDQTANMDASGRFDFMRDARWHRVQMDFTGPVELSQAKPHFTLGGFE